MWNHKNKIHNSKKQFQRIMKKYDYNPNSALNLNRAQKGIYEGKLKQKIKK